MTVHRRELARRTLIDAIEHGAPRGRVAELAEDLRHLASGHDVGSDPAFLEHRERAMAAWLRRPSARCRLAVLACPSCDQTVGVVDGESAWCIGCGVVEMEESAA
jgi:hypothetical protein